MDREAAERVPGGLAALTGGAVASMWQLSTRDLAVVGAPASNVPAEAVAAYQAHYYQYDPWGAAIRTAPFETVLRGAEIVDDAALARSVYYNEFAQPLGMFHVIGLQVALGATVGVVSILRSRAAGGFDEDAVAALQRAAPHIKGAFRLREQAGTAATGLRMDGLDAALESFGVPAVVLDGHGVALRMNAKAGELAIVRGGLGRRGNPHGVLRLHAAGSERLAALVAGAARGEAGGQFWVDDGSTRLLATVTPLAGLLGALAGPVGGRVLLLLRGTGPDRAGLARSAAALFGLTAAEAEAAAALAEGLSPAEIASARGVKVSTVRTLLQRAQDKAGCRNLRDLVRVLASLG